MMRATLAASDPICLSGLCNHSQVTSISNIIYNLLVLIFLGGSSGFASSLATSLALLVGGFSLHFALGGRLRGRACV